MKKALFGLALVGALVGGAVVLNQGELDSIDKKTLVRPARVPCDKIIPEDCTGGVVVEKEFCVCLTHIKKGDLPDEESTVPPGKKVRLVVCEITDPEIGKHLAAQYEPEILPIRKNCRVVANDLLLPGLSMHNVPTGIEAKLEVTCAPCKIGPDSWGPCPECAFRGDCDKLCKEETNGL